jgi:hypothetical protein
MKLVVPYKAELHPSDRRLIQLAELCGLTCEQLVLDPETRHYGSYIETSLPDNDCCLVINSQVIKNWTGGRVPPDLISCLLSRFPFLFVHSLSPDVFDDELVKSLSGGCLQAVKPIGGSNLPYQITADHGAVCGAFSGVRFGPANPINDCVFITAKDRSPLRTAISIGGSPFMIPMKRGGTEILFLASADTLDVNVEFNTNLLRLYFSRFVPHVMGLRHIFGEACWRPCGQYASLIIDDPLLRPQYGFLNFEALLRLMEKYNFCTTVAFIPHNYRRNSARIVQMFRKNDKRLAICFHGNDHTAGEFASADGCRLNTMIRIAETRMKLHRRATGLSCHKVMVFPQGNFSDEAVRVLKSRNFIAAVNSIPYPVDSQTSLTLGQFMQPAILRYGGFSLFVRKPIREITVENIAFNCFFGQPVLIVGHHETLRNPEPLIEAVTSINSFGACVQWCDVQTAIARSLLKRKIGDSIYQFLAYSSTVHISNNEDRPQHAVLQWSHSHQCPAVDNVLQDGVRCDFYEVGASAIRLSVELGASCTTAFSVRYRNVYPSYKTLGFRWNARAVARRRLSEIRDNYVTKNHYAMTITKRLGRFLGCEPTPNVTAKAKG